MRTAPPCFGADASHGYERTRLSTLVHLAAPPALYIQAGPTLPADRQRLLPSVEGLSHRGSARAGAPHEPDTLGRPPPRASP